MTTHTWADTRARATELFNGETPRAQLEQDIVNVFSNQPALVIAAVEQVGARYANGSVRSGWAVLRAHIVSAAAPTSSVTATDTSEREKRIAQAEQWLRACGPHYDRESEAEDELFGDRGLLKPWADDEALKARMLSAWREQRPRGEQIEREQAEADERWAASHTCQRCGNMRPFLMAPCPHCRRVTTVELGRNEPALGRTPEPALGGAK